MGGRIAVHDLLCFGYSGLDRPALLVGRILETGRLIDFHADLSIPVQSGAHCGWQNVGPNLHRRQIVACGVIAKVGGRGQHQRPRRNPEPELFFLVRVEGQVVRFCGIPLEKPGQGLAGVHDLQETGIVDQFLVLIRAWRRRCDQLKPNAPEFVQKGLISLAAEAPQNGGFIQSAGGKGCRVNVSISDALIVGQQNARRSRRRFFHRPHVLRGLHAQQLHRIPGELLTDAQGQNNQRPTSGVLHDQPTPFQLLSCLAQAEALKQRSPSTLASPEHSITLVWFQRRIYL